MRAHLRNVDYLKYAAPISADSSDNQIRREAYKQMAIMIRKIKISVCIVFTATMVATLAAKCEAAHTVKAVLVDQESSLHTSVSNRDVYRLRIMPRKGAAFEAVAIDSYPSYAEALPLRGLVDKASFSITLVRTPYCDQTSNEDGNGTAVRCFAIVRDGWKAPKNAVIDLWWR
jgi:hypothetical protein